MVKVIYYEIKKIIPDIKIYGLDISKYAIENSKQEVKEFLTFEMLII